MQQNPIISIHILTYNSADTIRQTLDSVIHQQTSFPLELVISDDASQDNTPSILKDYKKRFPEIINLEINESNKGIVKNYFDTLLRCRGKYVFDLAGDDFFNSSTAIEQIVVEMEKSGEDIGFIEFEYDELIEQKSLTIKNVNRHHRNFTRAKLQEKGFLGQILPAGWCMNTVLLKKLTSATEYLNNKIDVEDYPIVIELSQNCVFKHSKINVMTYRVREGSVSKCKTFDQQIEFANRQLLMSKYFLNKYELDNSWWIKRMALYYQAKLNIAIQFKNKNKLCTYKDEMKENKYKLSFKMKCKVLLVSTPHLYGATDWLFKKVNRV
nr:glycosyltransferase family 2 protein [uncultured Carboxylicivirga sp.]